jgi:prephenate dehydrogenase
VGQTAAIVRAMAPHLEPGTLITDAGSTKSDVVAAFNAALTPAQRAQVVPAHPIAGAEKSGVAAAQPGLFEQRRVVLTPLAETAPQALERVSQAWAACGANVCQLDPLTHDRIFAAVSHLPHLLAFALVDEFASRPEAAQLFQFAGGGFRDFTRIASSHPEMWRDICLANRDALLDELDRYQAELSRLRELLKAADGAGLEAVFARARSARDTWLETLQR